MDTVYTMRAWTLLFLLVVTAPPIQSRFAIHSIIGSLRAAPLTTKARSTGDLDIAAFQREHLTPEKRRFLLRILAHYRKIEASIY